MFKIAMTILLLWETNNEKNSPLFTMWAPESNSYEISHSWDILMSSRATVAFDDKTVASKINYNYKKTNY